MPFGSDHATVFHGAPEYLGAARRDPLPACAKIYARPLQVAEARASGRRLHLLIMARSTMAWRRRLEAAAHDWGRSCVAEVHDEAELDRAPPAFDGPHRLNNRNLHTFETTLETTERLAPRVPKDGLVVSESGLLRPPIWQPVQGRRQCLPDRRKPDAPGRCGGRNPCYPGEAMSRLTHLDASGTPIWSMSRISMRRRAAPRPRPDPHEPRDLR